MITIRRNLVSLLTLSMVCAVPANGQQDIVNDFIQTRGCGVTKNWQAEFSPQNSAPFGKAFQNWTSSDFRTLRVWIEKCLDPFVAVKGRKEWFLEEVDRQLRYHVERHQKLLAEVEEKERRQKAANQQAEAIDDLRKSYDAKLAQFDAAQADYVASAQDVNKLQKISPFSSDKEALQPIARFIKSQNVAYALYAELKKLNGALSERGAGIPLPAIETTETRDATNQLTRLQKVTEQWTSCRARLVSSGIPQTLLQSQMLVDTDADGYLFQYLCKAAEAGNKLEYLGNKGAKQGIRVSALQFWVDVRQFPNWTAWGPVVELGTSGSVVFVVEAIVRDERQVAETPIQSARLGAAVVTIAITPH